MFLSANSVTDSHSPEFGVGGKGVEGGAGHTEITIGQASAASRTNVLTIGAGSVFYNIGDFSTARWPSGLRRQTKDLVRKGVGSNPTLVIYFCSLSSVELVTVRDTLILSAFWYTSPDT